jgi:hypothetical protein
MEDGTSSIECEITMPLRELVLTRSQEATPQLGKSLPVYDHRV